MKYRAVPWKIGLGVAALCVAPLACGDSGLVGGTCADGYELCDGVCVAGGCGNGTGGGSGAPAGGGGPGTGGQLSSGGLGQAGQGGEGTGGAPSGGTGGGSSGSGGTDLGGAAGSGGSTVCDVPPLLTNCHDVCVDTDTDALHCGQCDLACASGICVTGACIGANPGHMIAMCMNYAQYAPTSAQRVLLGNAVFLTNQTPARVLAYVADTPTALRNTTLSTIAAAASALGRSYQLTEETNASNVVSNLNRSNYDVLLVYDQPTATAGELGTTGSSWNAVAQQFAKDGGTVVVLAGQGGVGEVGQLISGLGILNVSGLIDRVAERLYVQAPGDALGINVVSPFLGINDSCAFSTADSATGARVFVVTDANPNDGVGAPVVVHVIVQPD